jgi:DNA-binding NarL/FixJ family response regulator
MNEEKTICVLLIEDSPLDLFLFRALLLKVTGTNFQVLHAERLSDAFPLLQESEVDVVVTDLNLPDGSGLEVVRALIRHNASLPVLVMTGYADSDIEGQLLRDGACGVLPKDGLTAPVLSGAIHDAIEAKRVHHS